MTIWTSRCYLSIEYPIWISLEDLNFACTIRISRVDFNFAYSICIWLDNLNFAYLIWILLDDLNFPYTIRISRVHFNFAYAIRNKVALIGHRKSHRWNQSWIPWRGSSFYYIHSEINGVSCNKIGSKQSDFSLNQPDIDQLRNLVTDMETRLIM